MIWFFKKVSMFLTLFNGSNSYRQIFPRTIGINKHGRHPVHDESFIISATFPVSVPVRPADMRPWAWSFLIFSCNLLQFICLFSSVPPFIDKCLMVSCFIDAGARRPGQKARSAAGPVSAGVNFRGTRGIIRFFNLTLE